MIKASRKQPIKTKILYKPCHQLLYMIHNNERNAFFIRCAIGSMNFFCIATMTQIKSIKTSFEKVFLEKKFEYFFPHTDCVDSKQKYANQTDDYCHV